MTKKIPLSWIHDDKSNSNCNIEYIKKIGSGGTTGIW